MAVDLTVPEVGESITEVEIGEWIKKEGDLVNQDDTIVMIETDKVTVELPAPVSGKITKITKQQGDTAAVGDVIGTMEEGEGRPAETADAPSESAGEPAEKRVMFLLPRVACVHTPPP